MLVTAHIDGKYIITTPVATQCPFLVQELPQKRVSNFKETL